MQGGCHGLVHGGHPWAPPPPLSQAQRMGSEEREAWPQMRFGPSTFSPTCVQAGVGGSIMARDKTQHCATHPQGPMAVARSDWSRLSNRICDTCTRLPPLSAGGRNSPCLGTVSNGDGAGLMAIWFRVKISTRHESHGDRHVFRLCLFFFILNFHSSCEIVARKSKQNVDH